MANVKITAVSYLNTIPFLYGIRHSAVADAIDMTIDTPAVCAQQLASGQTDVSLVPVAAIPGMPYYQYAGNFCIGAVGKVRSVALFTNTGLQNLKTVYLDAESRTSVMLARVLARNYWKIEPTFKPFFGKKINDHEGCVLIGDKALRHEGLYTHRYDLAEAWIQYTGMPFAFAAWTANKPLPASFLDAFNEALDYGVRHIPQALDRHWKDADSALPCPYNTALEYLQSNIHYPFDEAKKSGVTKFWNLLNDFAV
ncbi:MAG: menaquinone biosynthesis protein [Prevotellaceae bacterium]|jgi:chorismate dehydratase|nr:menaquinone biosynthesis protein [Prevotellaceae bacterium]